MQLVSLIYSSRKLGNMTLSQVVEMADKASLHNKSVQVTGQLLFRGGSFLQLLEGPIIEVSKLYNKICNDPRHSQCLLLRYVHISNRQFEDWNMRYVDLGLFTLPSHLGLVSSDIPSDPFPMNPDLVSELMLWCKEKAT